MHLKRYEVVDMAEAISQIKRDLGPDAIILSTRTIHKRGGIFRLVDKPLSEVIAAAEQLKIYGNIIATPVIVAADREEFSQALRQTRDFEEIFIDSAGRCHRNTEQRWELQGLLSHPWPIEAHLVLSATTRGEEAEEMIRQFSVIPLQSLLFTQLDESSSLGSLFNLAVHTAKPLSYLTTGQRAPEDFEVAAPERSVDLCWHGFWR